ncbi:hypothetical protein VNI00_009246 [Paramarasmius palmivorus]|uniref:Uncharacterized protein n=1 Tax=Paramarasmius palmivorus TaxID=297713 RepID=A0AAW0CSU6_9AGAR
MKMSVTQLEAVIKDKKIELSSDYPHRYISTLQDDNLVLALKAIIIGYLITDGREIPRELQVDAVRMATVFQSWKLYPHEYISGTTRR